MTVDEVNSWWDQAACRHALADSRWDRVLAIAMQATGADQRDIADATGLSQSYVSRISTGARTPRQVDTIAKLCRGLGIPPEHAGLRSEPEEEETTKRRKILTTAGGTFAAGLVGAIGGGDLTALASPTQVYRGAEATTASRMLRTPAGAHLGFLRALAAEATDSSADFARLQVLIAEAAGFCGWLAVDCDEISTARQHYRLAVDSAAATSRPLLSVYMQASLAQFVSGTEDHRNATLLAQRARTAMPRHAPPIARVWLDCVEAVILARGGNHDSLALLDSAERQLTSADPVWPWLQPFDAAKLDSYRQLVNVRLRRDYTTWPNPKHPSQSPAPKQAAGRIIERAQALAALDEPEQACAAAATVFDVARHYRSEALTRQVVQLRTRIAATGREVDNLDARLASMY